jgi:hypothetical protein
VRFEIRDGGGRPQRPGTITRDQLPSIDGCSPAGARSRPKFTYHRPQPHTQLHP